MRVLFQVEGWIDLFVLPRLVEKIAGHPIEAVDERRPAGGWASCLRTLEAGLSCGVRQGCEHAVIAVDADSTPRHDGHGEGLDPKCRRCAIDAEVQQLRHKGHLQRLHIAAAVPVEAIEAWLLQFGHVVRRAPAGRPQHMSRRDVKRRLWGTETPAPREYEFVAHSILERLGPAELDRLSADQPSFGAFREAVAAWGIERPEPTT